VRVADGKGGNWTATVGTADDLAKADGKQIFDFCKRRIMRATELASVEAALARTEPRHRSPRRSTYMRRTSTSWR
jgi:hypothetical protein